MKYGTWTKPSKSAGNGQCFEVRPIGDVIQVRDSKDPDGPVLTFTQAEWEAAVDAFQKGEFNL